MSDQIYKIHINDRNYTSWDVYDTINFNKIGYELVTDPINSKLFTNDVFSVNKNKTIMLLHSSVRSGPSIPCVLILTGNKTYGRESQYKKDKNDVLIKRTISKNNRLLYKCMPDDTRLPCFLVPYELKSIGFSKVIKNIYVTICFNNWEDKHPMGTLDQVIGTVDVLDNFYEYQLYCKSLNASIKKFQKDTTKALENSSSSSSSSQCGNDSIFDTIKTKYKNIEDRTDQKFWNIIKKRIPVF